MWVPGGVPCPEGFVKDSSSGDWVMELGEAMSVSGFAARCGGVVNGVGV